MRKNLYFYKKIPLFKVFFLIFPNSCHYLTGEHNLYYPIRNTKNGVIVLHKGHFGIQKSKYLYALVEFVKGSSIEDTALAVSKKTRESVSKTMIKETFRVNLFRELVNFAGDEKRRSFEKFCEDNLICPPELNQLNTKLNQKKVILFTIYLREVFDLRHPMEIN